MPQKRADNEVSPELLASIDVAFGDFSREAALNGVPFHEFEAQLAAILNRVKEDLLAKREARSGEDAQE